MALLLLLVLELMMVAKMAESSTQEFSVSPPFANIDVKGHASRQLDAISLTMDSSKNVFENSMGRAFYQNPVRLLDPVSLRALSFSTVFLFEIVSFGLAGDGMAFFMAPAKDDPPEDSRGAFLGFVSENASGDPRNHLFGVEFDTHSNEFDPQGDHIGVDINTVNSSEVAALPSNLSLVKNMTLQAWIIYEGDAEQLKVFLARNGSARWVEILACNVSLGRIILPEMYLGFSAATGHLSELHKVFSWSFLVNSSASAAPAPSPSPSPPHKPAAEQQSKKRSRNNAAVVKIVVPLLLLAFFAFLGAIWICYYRRGAPARSRIPSTIDSALTSFTYKELYSATRGFNPKELLGKGGSSTVYKGCLSNTGSVVAVKALSGAPRHAEAQFLAELSVISRVRHQNLVALRGWCHEKNNMLLVYEYMPNGSLDRLLFSSETTKVFLSWRQRYEIIKGVAEALAYLHGGLERRIVHRDVKAANILLDEKLGAKLGDFGLARLMEQAKGAQTMTKAGTVGYIAPELAYTGRATEKSDVYSFGILVLEMVSGRQALDHSVAAAEGGDGEEEDRLVLLDCVWRMHELGGDDQLSKVVDSRMGGEEADLGFREQALVVIRMGLLCCLPDAKSRPSMRKCCQVLAGEAELPRLPELRPRAVSIDLFCETKDSRYESTTTSSSSGLISSTSSSSYLTNL